jgi:hypothetical protein
VEDRLFPQEKIMSLKEALLGLIDNVSLPAIFSRKAENLKELRQPLLKGISNAKRQFENGQTRAPHRWWRLSNDVVALTVKVSGNVFTINGVDTNHIPSDRFADFLDKFTAAVDAGEFDHELRHKGAGDATVKIPKVKRATAKPALKAKSAATTAATTIGALAAPAPSEATPATAPVPVPVPKLPAAKAAKASAPKPKSPAAKARKAAAPKPKREPVAAKTAQTEKPTATTVPTTVEAPAAPASAETRPAPKPKSFTAKAGEAVSPKPKRKPVDAKTAYARATKAAATRAANKAQIAGPAVTKDDS